MRVWKHSLIACVSALLFTQYSCEDNGTQTREGIWDSLGFEDKLALRLVLAEGYLYVCAGPEGVWRLAAQGDFSGRWEYMGLRDSLLGRYANVGTLDIDVLDEDVLAAYNGSAPHVPPESTVSIWRSTNGGGSWFRSDSGIPESITDPNEYNAMNSVQRSPHRSDTVLAVYGPARYRSVNNGSTWSFVGTRGVTVNQDKVRWNPYRLGEAWLYGVTSVFAPYLHCTRDFGETIQCVVSFVGLGFLPDGAVHDVAFDPGDPGTVYAATSYGVIKTTDGGNTWQTNAVRLPDGGFIFRMVNHPTLAGALYLAGGNCVYYTTDGGLSVKVIGRLEQEFVQSLAIDVTGNQLFVGTDKGIRRLGL